MEGVILFTAGRPAEAVPALERAAKLAPDSALVYRNLGAAYHGADRYAEATTSLQTALQIKPDPAVYNNLGTVLFTRGLYDQSVDAFDRAVKMGANEDPDVGQPRRRVPVHARTRRRRARGLHTGYSASRPAAAQGSW